MSKINIIIVFALLLTFTSCTPPKRIFFFDEPIPPQIRTPGASQKFFDHPPLYTPKGNRKTLRVYSPHFTLAIPNAMDMTGCSADLQRSIADMLYTELYMPGSKIQSNQRRGKTQSNRRIDLLDRGALINVDLKIILDSLYNKRSASPGQKEKIKAKKQEIKINTSSRLIPKESVQERPQINIDTKNLVSYLKRADGILLTYITSRVGNVKGYFGVDYRIVINKGFQEKIVLLAGYEKIRYHSSRSKGIECERQDVRKIAHKIYGDMTLQISDIWKAQIIKYDPPTIVINIGKKHNLMPGMIGYVVEWDVSVKIHSENKNEKGKLFSPRHYSYIAEFIVMDVFDYTSNALLIPDESDSGEYDWDKAHWDVKVDDVVVIK